MLTPDSLVNSELPLCWSRFLSKIRT